MSKKKELRNIEIVKKRKQGISFGKLAEMFNITKGRVFQIWAEYLKKEKKSV